MFVRFRTLTGTQGSKVSKGARKRGQLASLLVEAYQNREVLEEKIAEGRRNRKEAGNKYGAVHIFLSDSVFRLIVRRVLIIGEQPPSWLCERSFAPLAPVRLLSVKSAIIRPIFLCGSLERGCLWPCSDVCEPTQLSSHVDTEDIASLETEYTTQSSQWCPERDYTLVVAQPIILQYARWSTELAAMTSLRAGEIYSVCSE